MPIITFTDSLVPAAKNITIATMNGGIISTQLPFPILKSKRKKTIGSSSTLISFVINISRVYIMSSMKTIEAPAYITRKGAILSDTNSTCG